MTFFVSNYWFTFNDIGYLKLPGIFVCFRFCGCSFFSEDKLTVKAGSERKHVLRKKFNQNKKMYESSPLDIDFCYPIQTNHLKILKCNA